MNLKLEIEFSKAELLQEVDALKKQIDDMRPLPEDVEGRVMQKLRLDWNYHSNAIEGNRLSYGETVAFLMEGITAKGKPLKDHLDIRGHNEAINFLLSIVKESRPISEADIRSLHKMILVEPYDTEATTSEGIKTTKRISLGEYKTSANHVKTATGEMHYYATPEETPAKMQELMEWYSEASQNLNIHPVIVAALFHHKFVAIHPFDDGNGRLSRILMNLILMQKGYPPVIIKKDDRQNYYSLLSRADNGENWPFVEYIAERLGSSLQLFLKAAMGGDIDEDEDVDEKEIELLKVQLGGGMIAKDKKSTEIIQRVFFNSILPLSLKIEEKAKYFQDYFFTSSNWLRFFFLENRTLGTDLEYIGKDYADKYKKLLSNDAKDFERIVVEIGFREYRNPENSFSLTMAVTVSLEKFYYRILINNDLILSKLYHEELTTRDESKVIKYFIQNFKVQLTENQKSPKS